MKRMALILILVLGAILASGSAGGAGDFYVIPVGGTNIKPSDLIELSESYLPPGYSGTFFHDGSVFTVPPGKVLVINTIFVRPYSIGSGTLLVYLRVINNGFSVKERWSLYNNQPYSFHYSPGLIIPSGFQLEPYNHASSTGGVSFTILGYLADDR
jgi:hypothetical protein